MINLSEKEKKVLKALLEGLPISKRPFLEIGKNIGITEKEVLEIIKNLVEKKIIRRFGVTLRQNLVGFKGNAMVVWKISDEKIEEIGNYISKLPYISHCYVRKTHKDWDYNFYIMIHGKNKKEINKKIKEISEKFGISDYKILFTKKEIVRKHASYNL